ncbi:histidine kinase [Actinomycetospora lutea]|uniref:sensor histidine kinase n=1 Tax=Actinomycetospora lutea TaxID=663604 RepID=UPI0023672923|nr:histidine kinase [Actinomycetospora lutea]MDD7939281.1 histidine kinase [Actinomycetospora lutea]
MDATCPPDRSAERWAAWTTGAVVLVLGGLTLISRTDIRGSTLAIVVDAGATLVACALVPLLIRRPVAGALAMAVLAAFSPAATPAATIGVLRVATVRPLATAVAVGAAGAVAHAVQGLVRPIPGLPYGWLLVIDVVTHAALVAWGALVRLRTAAREEERRRAEAEQAARIAAARRQERATIAREMHDVLGHRLSLVAASAGALEYRPDAPAEQIARAAGVVRAGAHQALEELREVIGVLRADDLVGVSGDARPQPTSADLPALVEESREAGLSVSLSSSVEGDPPETLGRTAYRIVQEGLTNARKHAAGVPVSVVVAGAEGEVLRVEVVNRLPVGAVAPDGRGTGLVGLVERAASVGGRLEHGRTADGEFRLLAELPWPE